MHREYRAGRIAEQICANAGCLSFGDIRDMGAAPEAVALAENVPCGLFAFRALGIGWVCAHGARPPLVVVKVAEFLADALRRERGGHVVLYYRNLRRLGPKDYSRALAMLRWLARTCGCEIRANSYRCRAECVAGALDGLALKLREHFGVQI